MKENKTDLAGRQHKPFFTTANMVACALLSACAVTLMQLEFPLPFIAPVFYEFDLSDMPALIGAFSMGPVAGIIIELVKNLVKVLSTTTAGVGELSNFVLGCIFVLPAAFIYKYKRTKKSAIWALVLSGALMSLAATAINAFVMIPLYSNLMGIPFEAILGMVPSGLKFVDTMWEFCLICVLPFNAIKAIIVSLITIFIYKPLSVLIKGFN